MLRLKVFGSPNIGLYLAATNRYFLYHSQIPRHKVEMISKELDVEGIQIPLIDTVITSPFLVCNSNGGVVPDLFEEYAYRALREALEARGVSLGVVDHKYNALGNTIVANDKGAVVSPVIPLHIKRLISDVLDVEVSTSTVGRFSYTGSLVVVNNRAGLVAPVIHEDEKLLLEDVLGVKLYEGTVNGGVEFIKLGLVVNDYGVLVGDSSQGPELMNISTIFEGVEYVPGGEDIESNR